RVTHSGAVAGRGAEGAGAAGGFSTNGGKTKGAGHVHYDRSSGDISQGGGVGVNGQNYPGQDGGGFNKTDSGWEQAGRNGEFKRTDRPDASLQRESAARDRGFERDRAANSGFERQGAAPRSFDRGGFGGGYSGHMGGMRGGFGGGGFRRR